MVIPKHERSTTMKAIISILAAAVATAVLALPATAGDTYIPGLTDVPSRGHEIENGGLQRYVPGVTDFPSYAPESPVAPAAETYVTDGFDWIDAGFGAAVGLALGALAGILLLAARKRADLRAA
jgi:hypothetical protein